MAVPRKDGGASAMLWTPLVGRAIHLRPCGNHPRRGSETEKEARKRRKMEDVITCPKPGNSSWPLRARFISYKFEGPFLPSVNYLVFVVVKNLQGDLSDPKTWLTQNRSQIHKHHLVFVAGCDERRPLAPLRERIAVGRRGNLERSSGI